MGWLVWLLLTEYYEGCDAVGEGEEAVEELLGRGGGCFLHVGFHCVVCIIVRGWRGVGVDVHLLKVALGESRGEVQSRVST